MPLRILHREESEDAVAARERADRTFFSPGLAAIEFGRPEPAIRPGENKNSVLCSEHSSILRLGGSVRSLEPMRYADDVVLYRMKEHITVSCHDEQPIVQEQHPLILWPSCDRRAGELEWRPNGVTRDGMSENPPVTGNHEQPI